MYYSANGIPRQRRRDTDPCEAGDETAAWFSAADSGRYIRIRLVAAAADNLSRHYRLTATTVTMPGQVARRVDGRFVSARSAIAGGSLPSRASHEDSFLEVEIAILLSGRLTRKPRVCRLVVASIVLGRKDSRSDISRLRCNAVTIAR